MSGAARIAAPVACLVHLHVLVLALDAVAAAVAAAFFAVAVVLGLEKSLDQDGGFVLE